MKDEHHEMKKRVLAYEQQQEEEAYSGTALQNAEHYGLIF